MDEVSAQFMALPDLNLNIDDPIYGQAKDMVSQAAESFSKDPITIEGAVFQDISHLALDFSAFWVSSENTTLLRFVIFVGRLCSILSDYIPDHSMRPDELVFQSVMIVISSGLLTRSIFPWIKASLLQQSDTLPHRRDVIAYRNLFEPVGINWIQFKTLLARQALEWVDISIDDQQRNYSDIFLQVNNGYNQTCLYWVYDRYTKSFQAPDNIGELACLQFLRKLEKQQKQNYGTFSSNSMYNSSFLYDFLLTPIPKQNGQSQYQNMAILRVNSEKMIEAIEDNDDLDLSILMLVVKCLQSKITKNHTSMKSSSRISNLVTKPVSSPINESYLSHNFNHVDGHFSNKSSSTHFDTMESQDQYS